MTDVIETFWARYRQVNLQAPQEPPVAFPFCDNEADAEICAELVLKGQKRATAACLAELELAGEKVPEPGDFAIVTRWSGEPVAVIRTRSVAIERFADVTEAFAKEEGEGDLTLAWWREAHEAYYKRVLAGTEYQFSDDLLIACERFEKVFPLSD